MLLLFVFKSSGLEVYIFSGPGSVEFNRESLVSSDELGLLLDLDLGMKYICS